MVGLAISRGTEVEPTCSTRTAVSPSAVWIRSASRAKMITRGEHFVGQRSRFAASQYDKKAAHMVAARQHTHRASGTCRLRDIWMRGSANTVGDARFCDAHITTGCGQTQPRRDTEAFAITAWLILLVVDQRDLGV